MIKGYISQRERAKKCCKETLVLFRDMLSDVSRQNPTDNKTICRLENYIFIGTGLIDMYAKCGCIYATLCIFMLMTNESEKFSDLTAMGTDLAVHGRGKEALAVTARSTIGTSCLF
ncbi:hypothetical protein V6N13_067740 [Hibiscus sabdariffa]